MRSLVTSILLLSLAFASAAEPFRNVAPLELKDNANPVQEPAREYLRQECALAGFRVRYGQFVNGIAPIFARVNADGSLGDPVEGPFVGDDAKGAAEIRLLKPGHVVVGLKIRGGWILDSLSVAWKKWDARTRSVSGTETVSPAYGGTGGDEWSIAAPPSSFAVGVVAYPASLNAARYLGGITLVAGNFLAESGAQSSALSMADPPSQLEGPRWKNARYAVLVSEATYADPAWQEVAETLRAKYDGKIFRYRSDPSSIRADLIRYSPRYACFVLKPQEAGKTFVDNAHPFMRGLDEDPYTDAVWAILTGLDAADALRVASDSTGLVVRYGLGGMLNWVNRVPEGLAFWEGTDKPGRQWSKAAGKAVTESRKEKENHGYTLVDILGQGRADAFWTSGHANQSTWDVFYPTGNAQFLSRGGQLTAVLDGERKTFVSENPKIYLGAGNCLIGLIDGPDAMPLAWIRSGGARQYFGYTVSTYYGFMGWGTGDYFFNTRNQLSFAESWYAANQCEKALLETGVAAGADAKAMQFELDSTILYGDPAWIAKIGADPAIAQPLWVASSRIDKAGSGRIACGIKAEYRSKVGNAAVKDSRPFFSFLPTRLKNPRILRQSGPIRASVVTDDFVILIMEGESIPKGTVAEIVVEGEPLD